ncbi:MAG: hypothetical protein SFW66_08910 [Gammaproteobacteria bacterium]|nr:hypothetical protein [Gammaproteobacteria bacterium]
MADLITDEELAQLLTPAKPTSIDDSFSRNIGVHTETDKIKSDLEEKSPLSILERLAVSFANPSSDEKGLKKYLKSKGYETKKFAGDIYAKKKGAEKYGNIDPLPEDLGELAKDYFVDLGDYLSSIGGTTGAAAGGAVTALTGGYGAPSIPVLAGAGGAGMQKLKEWIGKKIGVVSEDAPSEAMQAGVLEGLIGTIPMVGSLTKTAGVKGAKGLMKNAVPAAYAREIGIREFAKKNPQKAKEIVMALINDGVAGTRKQLSEISDAQVKVYVDKIDDILSKSKGQIGWQDIAGNLFKNLENKGSVIDPKAEKEALIDWVMKLRNKGTDLNPGLFPAGSKRNLVESEKIKRKLNDFVKTYYKQGASGKITPDQAELAGQTQEIIRDLVREKAGNKQTGDLVKALNQKLLAYNVLGQGIEGMEGKQFLDTMGTGASANAFSALAGSSGDLFDIGKYKALKTFLNSLPTELPVTKSAIKINKLSKKNPFTSAQTNAILQMIGSIGANEVSE